MKNLHAEHENVSAFRALGTSRNYFSSQPLQKQERLPFTVRIACSESDLEKAVSVRRSAYGRHLPDFAKTMIVEPADRALDSIVLIAESRFDNGALATMRIQTNECMPLPLQHSVTLPNWCASGKLAEATRLAVAGGASSRVVKMVLFKALFLLCEQREVDWLLITARSPIDREYEAMQFRDIFADRMYLPMAHVGGLPHRVMAGEVGVARQRWSEADHPLFGFVFETHHPDLNLADPRESKSAAAQGVMRGEASVVEAA